MLRVILSFALLIAFAPVFQARAAVVVFQGKTASPDMYDVYTPHATEAQMKLHEEEIKKQKDDAKAAGKELKDGEAIGNFPYINGPITVVRVLVQIGQRVVPTEWLMEYTIPRDFLMTEQSGLSQVALLSIKADLQKVQAEMQLDRTKLSTLTDELGRGIATPQAQADMIRNLDVLKYRQHYLEDALKLESESTKFRRDMARVRYGFKEKEGVSLKNVTDISSPGHGHILWINPDVKPGMVFTKLTRLFQLGTMDPLVLRALVHESKVPLLRLGDKARVTFDSMPGEVREAVITQINMTAEDKEVQLPSHFEVQLSLPNPGLKLKVGMRGNIEVTIPDTPRN